MASLLLALLLAGPAAPVPTDRSSVTVIEAGSIAPDQQGPRRADDGAPAVLQAEPIPTATAADPPVPGDGPAPVSSDSSEVTPAIPAAPVSTDSPVPPPSPMQVRLDRPFKAEIKAAADQLKISSCDLVRLSVATQLRKIRSGQIEVADLVGA